MATAKKGGICIANSSTANTLTAQRPKFSVAIQTEGYQRLINNTLQDPKRVRRFVAAITSAVSVNPALQECDVSTILSCALLGESLNLSPSPQLGQYFLVPFEDNKNKRKVATFILGYKGYIQLAIRSGQYKYINVIAIKKGELVNYNPLTEEIKVNLIQDEIEREAAETAGYYAYFEHLNGFIKTLYWSKSKMEQHAIRYSPGYKAKKGYTFWEKDFDSMAFKTMIRQLISKWGVMSIEMRDAFEKDDSIIRDNGVAEYIGGEDIPETSGAMQDIADGIIVDAETGEIIESDIEPPPPSDSDAPAQVSMAEI